VPARRAIRARRADAGSRRGGLASHRGTIIFVGSGDEVAPRRRWPMTRRCRCRRRHGRPRLSIPTHVVFAGDRRDELRRGSPRQLRGHRAGGGGIVSGVRATRAASDEELMSGTRRD
jgi:hypothetical protein